MGNQARNILRIPDLTYCEHYLLWGMLWFRSKGNKHLLFHIIQINIFPVCLRSYLFARLHDNAHLYPRYGKEGREETGRDIALYRRLIAKEINHEQRK